MNPIEFLQRVWGRQKGYVFLPKKADIWVESGALVWPQPSASIPPPDLEADSYFCPIVYSKPRRIKENAQACKWLYADLDAVNPRKLSLVPTIAYQTSPGRYQALWELDRRLTPSVFESLNQRLNYATGADKGGWHLTKVLRIPGTFNFKYGRKTQVKILWSDGPKFTRAEVEQYVSGVESVQLDPTVKGLVLPAETRESILKRVWENLDPRTRALLSTEREQPEGERSDRLWELECRLLEAGLEPEEVFVCVRDTVWNKFNDRRGGDKQLWAEIRKAHLHIGVVTSKQKENGSGLVRLRPRLVTYSDLLGSNISEPEWLVEDWWTLGSHGIIAGLPKSYKSLITLDLAVSVASETPFLNLFEINSKGVGPALVVQQENSLPLLRDRLWKIAQARGINTGSAKLEEDTLIVEFPPAIPLMFYNDFAFDMSMPDDRHAIEEVIQREGIKLVVFDPLYLMIGGADENVAQQMRPILSWLLRLRNLYNCSVVVVHHWGKGAPGRGGRGVGGIRLLGSTTIYGWLEAALYLEASNTDSGIEVVVEREFRERLTPPPSGFELRMGDIGDSNYAWKKVGAVGSMNRVLWALQQELEGLDADELASRVELGQKKLRSELAVLLNEGVIRVEKEGRRNIYIANTDSPVHPE